VDQIVRIVQQQLRNPQRGGMNPLLDPAEGRDDGDASLGDDTDRSDII